MTLAKKITTAAALVAALLAGTAPKAAAQCPYTCLLYTSFHALHDLEHVMLVYRAGCHYVRAVRAANQISLDPVSYTHL